MSDLRRRTAFAAVLLLLLASGPGGSTPALGQEDGRPDLPPPPSRGGSPRVDPRLLPEQARVPGQPGRDDRVTIDVFPEPGRERAARAALEAVGGDVRRVGTVFVVTLDADAIDGLSGEEAIRWAQPSAEPIPDAVTAESVSFASADAWHAAGLTGSGVSVAVVDLGFLGWEARRDAGELPGSVRTLDLCEDFPGDPEGDFEGSQHGTAVAEIVHDVAPDARIHLVCVEDLADLYDAVTYSEDEGIDIISHSVGWLNTGPGNGTGLLAPILGAADAAGITWVNSAGNYAQQHWRGPFIDDDFDSWNDFAPGDPAIEFTLSEAGWVDVQLKWDDWPVSSHDFDVYIYEVGVPDPVAGSVGEQTGTQPPTEAIEDLFLAAGDYQLRIWHYSGPPGPYPEFDLFLFGAPAPIDHNDPTRSLNDAAGAPYVIASGAACVTSFWFCSPAGTIEPYSSRGPNIDGVTKPDITGPDGVSTVSYGAQGFHGTSAAAPAVSGAAALLEGPSRCQPADALRAELLSNTQPKGDPNDYGAGLLLLDAPPATETLLRHEGADRYATAVAISQQSHPCGARVAYLATGTNHPDALAAGPAAARENAPILLTAPGTLTPVTRTELQRLAPEQVVVLGGPVAIADSVLTEVQSALPGVPVDRRWGSDRYATAAEVSAAVFSPGVEKVFVVTGENFPDALGGAAAAVAEGIPLLIVRSTSVPSVIADELQRLDPDEIVVLGGTAAVSSSVQTTLNGIAPASRITAADRYALGAEVSGTSWPDGAYTVYIAVGDRFPDALSAGPLTATANGPLLLVRTDTLPAVVATELDRLEPTRIVVLGGPAAVSASVAAEVATYQK